MDIRLSGEMDGIDAAKEIQRLFKLPVVYISSYSNEDTLERANTTEPSGYLMKPFSDMALRATVDTAIQLAKV